MEKDVYSSSKFIDDSRAWVNVAAHKETGHEVEVVLQGKEVKVCSRYWGIPCSWHEECFQSGWSKFKDLSLVPVTVITGPDGKEVERLQGEKSGSSIAKAASNAAAKIPGEKIGAVEWRGARALQVEGDAGLEKGEWKKSNAAYTQLSKMGRKAFKDMGTYGLKNLEKKGNDLFQKGKELIGSDNEEAKKILSQVADEFKPMPCAKFAADLVKEIDKANK